MLNISFSGSNRKFSFLKEVDVYICTSTCKKLGIAFKTRQGLDTVQSYFLQFIEKTDYVSVALILIVIL